MQFFNFTPQETKALIFLLVALLVGSGITLYKRSHPQFAQELVWVKQKMDAESQTANSLNKEPSDQLINLNKASTSELQLLPGVGPTLSQRIVEYRESQGPFEKIEDLMQVKGIGLKTFEKIQAYITVKEKGQGSQR
jgi:competence protein ComEA